MPTSTRHIKNGDTVLVDKEKVPKQILEASVSAVNNMLIDKPRERKPPTEKQLAARAKFTELAKQRNAETKAKRDAAKVNPDELDEIPEGKVLVKAVVNKRPGRPRKITAPSESETEVVSASAASTPVPKPAPKPAPKRKQPVQTETEESEPDGCLAVPMPRARKPAVPKTPRASQKKPARKPRSYYSETSETEAASESESEDEEMVKSRVRKYAEKTKARLEALRQIESQLKPQNKYAAMSIF
jgi:hypothetical protein